jgi:hypothetical protein
MKTLVMGNTDKEQTKILQALLDIKADGAFGPATKTALITYQLSKGLIPDGSCGPLTWKSFYYEPSKNANLYVQKIPFSKIIDIDVLLHDKDKTYTVSRFTGEYQADICINGPMFDMNTYQNVADLVIDGILNNGGNYSAKGLAFYGIGVYASTTSLSRGKPVDFIGGAPIIIQNGILDMDTKGLSAYYCDAITQRMTIGCDKENLFIITTGQANKSNLATIANEALFQKVQTLINLDGGGSTAQSINDRTVFTAGRPIPSAIALRVIW